MVARTEPNAQQVPRRALFAALLAACVTAPAAATTHTIATFFADGFDAGDLGA